jgi:hypothetical protein
VIKTHTKDALENSWRCFFKLLCVIGCRVVCFFSLRGGEYPCALLCVLLNTFLRTDLYLCALFLLLFFCSRVRNALPTRSTGTCGTSSGRTTSHAGPRYSVRSYRGEVTQPRFPPETRPPGVPGFFTCCFSCEEHEELRQFLLWRHHIEGGVVHFGNRGR